MHIQHAQAQTRARTQHTSNLAQVSLATALPTFARGAVGRESERQKYEKKKKKKQKEKETENEKQSEREIERKSDFSANFVAVVCLFPFLAANLYLSLGRLLLFFLFLLAYLACEQESQSASAGGGEASERKADGKAQKHVTCEWESESETASESVSHLPFWGESVSHVGERESVSVSV